jgi:hypothetical protein
MFHVGRCGSTVVAEMLGRHKAVTWDGEVFEPAVRRKIGFEDLEPDEFLRERREGTDDIYGFEVKYLPSHHQRVLGLDLDGLVALTDRVGVSHYVTLHRHNYLRRVVSGAIGRERRRWHRTHAEPAPSTAVRLDPKAVPFGPRQPLLAAFEEMKTGEADLETVLDGRSVLPLVYEEDVEDDPAVAYRQICDLIGVAPENIGSRLGRTGAAPLTSLLTNFDEIAELLTGTEYEWMLDKQTAN